MTSKPLPAVFIDLDGTLVDRDVPYEELTEATLRAHLGTSSPPLVDTYTETFFDAFHALQPDPFLRGMPAVLDVAGTHSDPAAMVETLHEKECEALSFNPAVAAVLEDAGTEAVLGVLTNGVRDWQLSKLRHVGLMDRFDAIVTSYEAGAHKPSLAPFDLAEKRVPADDYLLVGDAKNDIEGARKAGWERIRYDDDRNAERLLKQTRAFLTSGSTA